MQQSTWGQRARRRAMRNMRDVGSHPMEATLTSYPTTRMCPIDPILTQFTPTWFALSPCPPTSITPLGEQCIPRGHWTSGSYSAKPVTAQMIPSRRERHAPARPKAQGCMIRRIKRHALPIPCNIKHAREKGADKIEVATLRCDFPRSPSILRKHLDRRRRSLEAC